MLQPVSITFTEGTTMHVSSAQEQREFTLIGDKPWEKLAVGDNLTVGWGPRRTLSLALTEVTGRTFKGKTSDGHHISGSCSPETGTGFATISYG